MLPTCCTYRHTGKSLSPSSNTVGFSIPICRAGGARVSPHLHLHLDSLPPPGRGLPSVPWEAPKDTCLPCHEMRVSSVPPPILPRQIRVHPASLTRNVFPMPKTTYPRELFSGFRSNTYPLLGSLMEQTCGNERGEEAHSNPVPEDMAGTEHRPRLSGTDPIGEAAPGELMAPFGAASEAPQVGQKLKTLLTGGPPGCPPMRRAVEFSRAAHRSELEKAEKIDERQTCLIAELPCILKAA